MIYPFFEGLFFGLLLSVMIGPVFFTLIQTSIEQGYQRGLSVAAGATTSDILILLGCFLGYLNIAADQMNGKVLGLFGVVILFVTGFLNISKSKKETTYNTGFKTKGSILGNFIKGFAINSLNPFVFVFWLGVVSFTSSKYHYDHSMIAWFVVGSLVIISFTDFLKAFLSNKLRRIISAQLIHKTSVIVGIIIILYSVKLFYQLF